MYKAKRRHYICLLALIMATNKLKRFIATPFVSGLKQSVTRPFGQNVLRYQNTYYTLSTERIPYRKDKTEDDRFFILTLFALAGEIEARGAYSSEVQRIQLAVGCRRHTLAPRWSGLYNTLGSGEW